MKLILPLFFLLFAGFGFSQTLEWVNKFDANPPGEDSSGALSTVFVVVVDDFGNTFQVGTFTGTVDLDPGPDTHIVSATEGLLSASQLFVVKLDTDGNFIWAKTFPFVADDPIWDTFPRDAISGAAVSNGVCIVGRFAGTVDFDTGPGEEIVTGDANRDIFVLNLSADGDLVWLKHIEVEGMGLANTIDIDDLGNFYIGGEYSVSADFDPGPAEHIMESFYFREGFVSKFDEDFNFQWVRTFRSDNQSEVLDLKYGPSGSVYVSGDFIESIDLDPGDDEDWAYIEDDFFGFGSGFIAKLSDDGDLIWAHSPGFKVDYLALDDEENVIINGRFHDTADFDFGDDSLLVIPTEQRGYFSKYTADLEFQWVKQIVGPGVHFKGIEIDHLNSIYIFGISSLSEIDLDPSEDSLFVNTNPVGTDFFISGYDSEGDLLWGAGSENEGFQYIRDIAISDIGDIYVSGEFDDTVDFDFTDAVFNFWPEEFYSEPFMLKLESNCRATVRRVGDTLISNQTGAVYQWLRCDDSYSVIPGETNMNFVPEISGDYAVIMEKNGCLDTSECISVLISNAEISEESEYAMSIYPNPSFGFFTIYSNMSAKVEIYNSLGSRVYLSDIISGTNQVNLSSLSQGIYTLVFIGEKGDKFASEKIVLLE